MNAIYHPRDVFPVIDICSLWIKDLKAKEHTVKGEDSLLSRKVAKISFLQNHTLNLQISSAITSIQLCIKSLLLT